MGYERPGPRARQQEKSVTCGATINGPKVARNVVLWTKNCQNKTTHPSGHCHLHRRSWEA